MPWLQASLTITPAQAAAVEQQFTALDALSITYADAADQPLLEPAPGETQLWSLTRITALFEMTATPASIRTALQAQLAPALAATLEWTLLADQVWERLWLQDFHPMRFGRRLWICPDGQRPAQTDALIIDLDPGLAFGTGTHPTTALCLSWLDGIDLTQQRVLDYGCGSGILALAAARLGAAQVDAVDYDPQALEATQENALKNALEAQLRILAPEQLNSTTYHCVVANILARTLIQLAPLLTACVIPGGRLALSGILAEQTSAVIAAYQNDFILEPPHSQQDWVLIHGIRRTI